jgi:hypothetical protein
MNGNNPRNCAAHRPEQRRVRGARPARATRHCIPAGRFAAAINQPPLPLPSWGKAAGWLAARLLVGRSDALPPSHLLRLAFAGCGRRSSSPIQEWR